MFYSIYKIENKSNGKIYIGCTTNLEHRRISHNTALNANNHPCEEMQADFNNGDNFTISEVYKMQCADILKYYANTAMHGLEAYYTIKFNADISGYNKKHVATWTDRQAAKPIPPQAVKQGIQKDIDFWRDFYREQRKYRKISNLPKFIEFKELEADTTEKPIHQSAPKSKPIKRDKGFRPLTVAEIQKFNELWNKRTYHTANE